MSSQNKPDDWDWVTARAACDPDLMLAELRRLAGVYVAKRNAMTNRPGQPGDRFRINDNPGSFSIYDSWGSERRAVGMVLKGEPRAFQILRDVPDPPVFTATLELTDEGECRFRVGDELLQPWQLLRRMIEPLFFPTP